MAADLYQVNVHCLHSFEHAHINNSKNNGFTWQVCCHEASQKSHIGKILGVNKCQRQSEQVSVANQVPLNDGVRLSFKAMDELFGTCQRPVFSLGGVSQCIAK